MLQNLGANCQVETPEIWEWFFQIGFNELFRRNEPFGGRHPRTVKPADGLSSHTFRRGKPSSGRRSEINDRSRLQQGGYRSKYGIRGFQFIAILEELG